MQLVLSPRPPWSGSICVSRRFTLPQDIDAEKVTAEFKHGVLSVDIPRKPEPQAKQIAITVK